MEQLGIYKYPLKKMIVLRIILAYLQKLLLNLTTHHIKCLKDYIYLYLKIRFWVKNTLIRIVIYVQIYLIVSIILHQHY